MCVLCMSAYVVYFNVIRENYNIFVGRMKIRFVYVIDNNI